MWRGFGHSERILQTLLFVDNWCSRSSAIAVLVNTVVQIAKWTHCATYGISASFAVFQVVEVAECVAVAHSACYIFKQAVFFGKT
jgi:hypothetical protein